MTILSRRISLIQDHSTSSVCPTNESVAANDLEESTSESENVAEIELSQCNANNLLFLLLLVVPLIHHSTKTFFVPNFISFVQRMV